MSQADTCRQIALAVRDEVADLDRAGIAIIQVDEPAFREGLPLRRDRHDAYLKWATECFRLASAPARDETQIHTHMCYAEFGLIPTALKDLDVDVISFEAARSHMELLDELHHSGFDREWDLGSTTSTPHGCPQPRSFAACSPWLREQSRPNTCGSIPTAG